MDISFSALPFTTEASCLCYTGISTYAPSIFDGYWALCLDYYKTASPVFYSSNLHGDTVTRTPCAAAGNVLGTAAATGWCEQHRGDKYGSDCDCDCDCNCECGDHEYGSRVDEWSCSSGASYCWVNDCDIGWFDDYALVELRRSMGLESDIMLWAERMTMYIESQDRTEGYSASSQKPLKTCSALKIGGTQILPEVCNEFDSAITRSMTSRRRW
jgi:hypothetical protein